MALLLLLLLAADAAVGQDDDSLAGSFLSGESRGKAPARDGPIEVSARKHPRGLFRKTADQPARLPFGCAASGHCRTGALGAPSFTAPDAEIYSAIRLNGRKSDFTPFR